MKQYNFDTVNGFCNREVDDKTIHGTYTWEETEVGQNSSSICEFGAEVGVEEGMGKVTRLCLAPLMWETYYGSYCITEVSYKIRLIGQVSRSVFIEMKNTYFYINIATCHNKFYYI